MFRSLRIIGILICLLMIGALICRADQSNQSGNDFSSAVNLYMSAPVNSYDYQPAVDAFSKIAIEAKDKETEFRARYFLTLADFCATRFDEAYKQADACRALANQLYPEDISVKIADITSSGLSGLKGDNESNSQTVKDIIFANSRIKPMLPGTSGENLLGIAETIKTIHTLAPFEMMWPTQVYRNGRDKITRIRQIGNITADETLMIGMMEKNIACLKESTASQFALTCAVIALFIDKCGVSEDGIKNNINSAICCHNLRQLGIAFHMYALDNNGSFPPLSTTGKLPDNTSGNIPWMIQLAPYLKAQWGFNASGNAIQSQWLSYYFPPPLRVLGYYFPLNSVFGSPVCMHIMTWCIPAAYNGFATGWVVGSSPDSNTWILADCIPLGYYDLTGQKLAQLKYPSRQVLAGDATISVSNSGYNGFGMGDYNFAINTASPRYNGFVNVLYADGHVNEEDINWLWKADPSGTPWNSNNPYTPRNVGNYNGWLPPKP